MFFYISCSKTKYIIIDEFCLKKEINKEIIESFYNNDTIGKNVYLLK